ncbi:hemerythrin domain-containing protein [Ornithinimicrobium sp. F0845]|uniref:hemerythrin domain-containing protein n=1 Tax=Ornithinimicrobium sp. F0845 TaxID=2926412 RepID=UPI00248AD5DB|nr:hemerythrin domain-containing protein [Ornithinimicrobium sp. F0845]
MCSYCGCQSITVVGRFMAEHDEIINATGAMVRAAATGDTAEVRETAKVVARLLNPHTHAEEVGLFSVMREQEEFTDHIDVLCGEHSTLDELLEIVAAGDLARAPEFEKALRTHIDKEDNGLFPAAAMSLDGPEWERVDATTPAAEAPVTDGRGHLLRPEEHGHDDGHHHDHGHDHSHDPHGAGHPHP